MEGKLTLSLLQDRSVQMVFTPSMGAAAKFQSGTGERYWASLV